jgi:3-hydroxyacyl-CoA dehydrogenase
MFTSPSSTESAKARASRGAVASRPIRHVVVLGANGTMGYGSGAIFTSAVEKVTFLARTKEKAQEGLDAAVGLVRSGTLRAKVTCGSYDADFENAVGSADLIFEAVTEQLPLKRQFFARIDKARRPDSIVATVTSGLSINQLAEGCSESFRKNFCGLHFFNPPNVIVGTELIAGNDTDPALIDFLEEYATEKLGRVMVRTADLPGFAGNRIGFKVLNECAQLAEEHGPLLIDAAVGPYTGRALTPLATIDLVGWDIHRAIVDNIYANAPDEVHETLKLPAYMADLMAQGTLGNKSGKGFFMKDGKRRLVFEPKSKRYLPADEIELPGLGYVKEIAALHRVGRYEDAMAAFVAASGDQAKLARKVVAGYIAYSFERAGEVTADIRGIDAIMGFGFNWAPPSVLVDLLGIDATRTMIKEAGLRVPASLASVKKGDRLFDNPTVNIGKFFVAG